MIYALCFVVAVLVWWFTGRASDRISDAILSALAWPFVALWRSIRGKREAREIAALEAIQRDVQGPGE